MKTLAFTEKSEPVLGPIETTIQQYNNNNYIVLTAVGEASAVASVAKAPACGKSSLEKSRLPSVPSTNQPTVRPADSGATYYRGVDNSLDRAIRVDQKSVRVRAPEARQCLIPGTAAWWSRWLRRLSSALHVVGRALYYARARKKSQL